jgi:hypothetical protein
LKLDLSGDGSNSNGIKDLCIDDNEITLQGAVFFNGSASQQEHHHIRDLYKSFLY